MVDKRARTKEGNVCLNGCAESRDELVGDEIARNHVLGQGRRQIEVGLGIANPDPRHFDSAPRITLVRKNRLTLVQDAATRVATALPLLNKDRLLRNMGIKLGIVLLGAGNEEAMVIAIIVDLVNHEIEARLEEDKDAEETGRAEHFG